jgi:hypothetical protein
MGTWKIIGLGICVGGLALATGCKGEPSPADLCTKIAGVSKQAGKKAFEDNAECLAFLAKVNKEEPDVWRCLGPCVTKAATFPALEACRTTCKVGVKAAKREGTKRMASAKRAIATKYASLTKHDLSRRAKSAGWTVERESDSSSGVKLQLSKGKARAVVMLMMLQSQAAAAALAKRLSANPRVSAESGGTRNVLAFRSVVEGYETPAQGRSRILFAR